MTLSEELQWRGFVNQTTLSDITELDKQKFTFYWGVDPSAISMQIGNLAAAMMVRHFMKHGHKAYLLVGGATGLIGDPDGKSEERTLKSNEEIETNKKAIVGQYKQIFKDQHFEVVDNYDWFKDMGYLEFLRDIGKHVPMRQMLGRDFVETRLQEGGAGISYAEFSYVLIQGYDFLRLNQERGVNLQLCGSDQWGNSIAGVELIRRIAGNEAHIWTSPLILNKSTGKKFGKSEGGAVWLDETLTPKDQFYQFWLNLDDEGIEDYLKIFTELDKPSITSLMADFNENRASRLAQRRLAYEVTKIVHGEAAAQSAKEAAEKLFGQHDYTTFSAEDFAKLKLEVFTIGDNAPLINTLVKTGLASSNTEARRLLKEGAVYLNNVKISSDKNVIEAKDFVAGYVVIRKGKNTQVVGKK